MFSFVFFSKFINNLNVISYYFNYWFHFRKYWFWLLNCVKNFFVNDNYYVFCTYTKYYSFAAYYKVLLIVIMKP